MVRGILVLGSLVSLLALGACAKQSGSVRGAVQTASNTGIIGGIDAVGSEEYAQSVVILYNISSSALCTASIVSDSLLVTAAHCVAGDASSLRMVFGTELQNATNRIVRKVDAFKTSPIWPFRHDEEINSGDIAVVKFSGGLPPGYKAAQILADGSALRNGASVLLAGYGISNGAEHLGGGKLRSAEVTIENSAYSESEVLLDQRSGKGACHGDSGGPAFIKVRGQLMLWGVTNRGVNDPKNDCSVSAAYASIPYYKEWLQQTASELTDAPVSL